MEINCDDNFCESFFTAPRLSLRSAIKRRRPVVPAFASSHPSHPLRLRSGWKEMRMMSILLMRKTMLSRYPTQWQPWWGGRLRSCLYFGAGLQPEGWLEPHGSQISKSIAPPRPPWTPPAPSEGGAAICRKMQHLWLGVFGPRRGDMQRALIEAEPNQPTIFTWRRVWKSGKELEAES